MYAKKLALRMINLLALASLILIAATNGDVQAVKIKSTSSKPYELIVPAGVDLRALSLPVRELRGEIPTGKEENNFGQMGAGQQVGSGEEDLLVAPSPTVVTRLLATKAPRVNEAINLVLEVTAYADAPGTVAEILLPEQAQLLGGSTQGTFDLAKGQVERLEAVIAFRGGGELTVTGRAMSAVSEEMVQGDEDSLFLTVGRRQGSVGFASAEKASMEVGQASADMPNLTDPALQDPMEAAPEEEAGSIEESGEASSEAAAESVVVMDEPVLPPGEGSGPEAESGASAPQALVTVSICWILGSDHNGTQPPFRDAFIRLYDDDAGPDDLLNVGFTGYFNGCRSVTVDNVDVDEGGTIDVYYQLWLYHAGRYQVRTYANSIYFCQTATQSNIGGNHNFGTLPCGGGAGNGRSVRIYNDAYLTYRFVSEHALLSPLGADPGEVIIEWQTGGADGDHYHTATNEVHLTDAVGNAFGRDVVTHEVSHRYMDAVYGEAFPSPTGCPSPHFINLISAPVCAWTEGYTYVLVAGADNNPVYTFTSGATINLETPHWNSPGWDDGGSVEGRVGGVLIDLADPFTTTFGTATGFSNENIVGIGRDEASGMFDAFWDLFSDQNDQVFVAAGAVVDSFSNAWEANEYPRYAPHAVGHLNSIGSFMHD